MVEPSGHCPHLGLKQNRAIRFATPTPEHRCYVTGDAQDIPVDQASYCLSPGHVNCPLYMGLPPPSTAMPLPPIQTPAYSGLRGWLWGLSLRDRIIYGMLLTLLLIIISMYITVGIQLLLTGDHVTNRQSIPLGNDTATATLAVATDIPTPTPTSMLTRTPIPSVTATRIRTPTVTRTPSNTPTATFVSAPIIVPTSPPVVPTLPPVVPTFTPVLPTLDDPDLPTPGDPDLPTPGDPDLPTPGDPDLPTPGDPDLPTPGDPDPPPTEPVDPIIPTPDDPSQPPEPPAPPDPDASPILPNEPIATIIPRPTIERPTRSLPGDEP